MQIWQIIRINLIILLPNYRRNNWPSYWLIHHLSCLCLQQFSDRHIRMHTSHIRVISQHLVSNILCYFIIYVSDTGLLTCGKLVPLLLLFFLWFELLNLLLCLFTCNWSAVGFCTEICHFIIIIVFLLLISFSFTLLFSLIDPFHLLFLPIFLFFKFLYFLFQISQNILNLIVFSIVFNMICLEKSQQLINLFLLMLLDLLLSLCP